MKYDERLKKYYSNKIMETLRPTHYWVFVPKFWRFPKLCRLLRLGKREIIFLDLEDQEMKPVKKFKNSDVMTELIDSYVFQHGKRANEFVLKRANKIKAKFEKKEKEEAANE